MKKLIIALMIGVAVIMMSSGVSASDLLIDDGDDYTIDYADILDLDKCVCPECANVTQNGASTWLCDACLCPNYINESDYVGGEQIDPGWYLFAEDVCITKTIKWKSFGWILAVHNNCTNFDQAFDPCGYTWIEDNYVVVCGGCYVNGIPCNMTNMTNP